MFFFIPDPVQCRHRISRMCSSTFLAHIPRCWCPFLPFEESVFLQTAVCFTLLICFSYFYTPTDKTVVVFLLFRVDSSPSVPRILCPDILARRDDNHSGLQILTLEFLGRHIAGGVIQPKALESILLSKSRLLQAFKVFFFAAPIVLKRFFPFVSEAYSFPRKTTASVHSFVKWKSSEVLPNVFGVSCRCHPWRSPPHNDCTSRPRFASLF